MKYTKSIIFISIIVLISIFVLADSNDPYEYGNSTDITAYIGGKLGILNVTGRVVSQNDSFCNSSVCKTLNDLSTGTTYYDCVVALDGTGDYTHPQDCIDNVGGRIAIKEGNYTLNPRVRITKDDIHLIGLGNVHFQQPSSIPYGFYSYSADTNKVQLSVNALENDMNITVSDASGFEIGDLIRIYDNLPGVLHGSANISRGESTLIWNISGNVLFTVDSLRNNYNIAYDANVSIIPTFKNVRVSNIHINGTDPYNDQYCINFRNLQDSEIDHVTVSNCGGAGIGIFFDSYNIRIHDNFAYDILRPGLGYGLYGGGNAARHIYVYDNTMQNVDEGIDCGGAGGAYGWPTDLHWYNNHIYGVYAVGIDQHPVCTDVYISNNVISGATGTSTVGISADGENVNVFNNYISHVPSHGITLNADRLKGDRRSSGRHIIGNHLFNTGFNNGYAIGGTTSSPIDDITIANNVITKHGKAGGNYDAIHLGSYKNGSVFNNLVIDSLTDGINIHSSHSNVTEGLNYFYNVNTSTYSQVNWSIDRSIVASQPMYLTKFGLYVESNQGSALVSLQAKVTNQDPVVLFKNETGDYRWWIYSDNSQDEELKIKSDDIGEIMTTNHDGYTSFGTYSVKNKGILNIDNSDSDHLKVRLHSENTSTNAVVGLGFGVDTSNKYMKSSIAHQRTGGNGQGELLILVDPSTDNNDVSLSDISVKVTSYGLNITEKNITNVNKQTFGQGGCMCQNSTGHFLIETTCNKCLLI